MSIYHDQLERHFELNISNQLEGSADLLNICENTKRVEITGIAKAYFNNYVDRVSVCQTKTWA